MLSRTAFRPLAAFALTVGLFLTLPGCSKPKPDDKGGDKKDKKEDPKPLVPDPKVDTKIEPVKAPEKVDLNVGVGKEAADFLKELGDGKATAGSLSGDFVKSVGLPINPNVKTEKERGYSADNAELWLRRVGSGLNFGLPIGAAGADAALLTGSYMGPDRVGGYSLRMVKEASGWKVDYLALSSANNTTVTPTVGGPESEYQRFAARAVASLFCDKDGMPKDERRRAVAAGLTPAYRTRLAPIEFDSDKVSGFDHSPSQLELQVEKFGKGAESYSVTQQGDTSDFVLEVTKAGGAKSAFVMKLAKGTAPGQWLVENVTPK